MGSHLDRRAPPARGALRARARCLTDLPADVVQHILVRLTLAHDIARAAPTCHVLVSVAARNAMKVRPFSGEVVTLAGHRRVRCAALAAAPDGRIITGSAITDYTVKVWRDGACERTIQAHNDGQGGGGAAGRSALRQRLSRRPTAKLWTLDGALERTFAVGRQVLCVAALPDGVHFVVGLVVKRGRRREQVRLYHVDGTLVHTFTGHTRSVIAVAVTPDGQHIISGSDDNLVKVWSVATKSLVSTCVGHTDYVRAVAAMPDGQRILSGSYDNTVRVWRLNGTLENTFELHTNSVRALVALPDNQHALSGSRRQDRQALQRQRRRRPAHLQAPHRTGVSPWRCCPTASASSAARTTSTARIVYHGLAPLQ